MYYALTDSFGFRQGVEYREGMNISQTPNLAFFSEEQLSEGPVLTGKFMTTIWEAHVPVDANFLNIGRCARSDKLILSNPRRVTETEIVNYIRNNVNNLYLVPEELISEEGYLVAVKSDPFFLKEIPNYAKTKRICMSAILQQASLVQFVPQDKPWSSDVWCTAIQQHGNYLQFVHPSLYEERMAFAAIENDPASFRHVPNERKTEKLCLDAVTRDHTLLRFVPEELRTEAVWTAAILHDTTLLRSVPEDQLTDEMCLAAIQKSASALFSVPKDRWTEEMILASVGRDCGVTLDMVPEHMRSAEVCFYAAHGLDPDAIRYGPLYLRADSTQ